MIYLDNCATTFPKPSIVLSAVEKANRYYAANPGRSGHKLSLKASSEVYNCRENLRDFFNAKSAENVIFTLNCTTALNTVIKGVLEEGDHVIVSSLEHNSVMRPIKELEKIGVTYTAAEVFPFDNDATVDSFRKAIKSNTRLAVITHASNVFGIKLPIERICALLHQYGIIVCVDAAQTAGVFPIDVQNSSIDFLCVAGHKGLYGTMGTGALIINCDRIVKPLISGGTGSSSAELLQPEILPDKFESGTANVSGIAALNAGVSFVRKKGIENINSHEMNLITDLYDALKRNKRVILYTDKPQKEFFAPVLSFNLEGINSENTAQLLNEKYDIAVRAGLHCAPSAHRYMNTIDEGTVRVCPSVFTTSKQIDALIFAINEISKRKYVKNQLQ